MARQTSKRKVAAAPRASGRNSILAYTTRGLRTLAETSSDDDMSENIQVVIEHVTPAKENSRLANTVPLSRLATQSSRLNGHSHAPLPTARRTAADVEPPTKKQRLYFKAVEIFLPYKPPPGVPYTFIADAQSSDSTAPTTPAHDQGSSVDEQESSDDGITVGLSTPPKLTAVTRSYTSDDEITVGMSTPPQLPQISASGRPRRGVARPNYSLDSRRFATDSDSDGDELPRKRRKSGRAASHDQDDDFDQDSHLISEDEDDEVSLHATDEDDDSDAIIEDEDDSLIAGHSSDLGSSTIKKQTGKPTKKNSQARRPIDKDRMKNLRDASASKTGIHYDLPPLATIPDIFTDLTAKAVKLGLDKVCSDLDSRSIRVATMCSGSESPLLALRSIGDCLSASGHTEFAIDHVFSAEIEPFKQAFIERNFQPPLILRDIVEITDSTDGTATTAYGAKAKIPGNLDLLIAGTACVDYSPLNRHKKGLDDRGESGDTFTAVLNYAKTYRPRILILENIMGAPWMDMLDRYEAIDYAAAGGIVDTKEYYLPQTRQRGYMVCVDRANTGLSEKEAKKICMQWQDIMMKMKRPVSSPVSDFLTPNDDRQVILSRDRIAREAALDPAIRIVDWAVCEERHRIYRLSKGLGYAKPYTSWEPSGTLSIFDYADKRWQKSMVERIWDYEDCAILRKAREYDATFKRRIWDLSQNIDRFQDQAQFGIAPCLTPSGIFYLPDAGRPLTFAESLGLQGLPADKLHFTSETERQVQDLAGNAMSSTVVGSAIVAALIAAKGVLKTTTSETMPAKACGPTEASSITGLENLVPVALSVPSANNIDTAQLIEHAMASTSLCYCEGQVTSSKKPIQRCVDCNHTTCIECGGKPVHNYLPERKPRSTPQSFVQRWRSQIPMRLRLHHNMKDLNALLNKEVKLRSKGSSTKGKDIADRYRDLVQEVLSGEFTFSTFKRSSCWTVVYESTNAQLLLVIDGTGIHWELLGLPEPAWTGNDPLRKFLEIPIARINGNGDLLGGTWQWRVNDLIDFELEMTAKGSDVPAWTARLHMPGEEHKVMPETIEISYGSGPAPELDASITGTYKHLRNCGTACEALYKRADGEGGPMFMFLDPAPLGHGKDDHFVFSTNPERLNNRERRHIVASLNCQWRPWGSWKGRASKAQCVADCRWIHDPQTSLIEAETSLKILAHRNADAVAAHAHCSETIALASCDFRADVISNGFSNAQQIKPGDKKFFRSFAWAFEALRQHVTFEQEFTVPVSQSRDCATCAPPLPKIQWVINQVGALRPAEDSKSATRYEVARRQRPDIFFVEAVLEQARMTIKVGINGVALAQTAFARLSKMTSDGYHPTTWTIDTQFSELPLQIPAFRINPNDPRVYADVSLPSNVQLWEKQKQTLGWMRSQEADLGKEIVLEAGAEALLPHLGWRAEARATASQFVRGGILADHPGFGKTITSLSLIHSEFLDHDGAKDKNAAIIKSMRNSTQNAGGAAAPIDIAATLIICPSTIAKQWEREVVNVLGKEYQDKTLLVDSFAKFSKCSIDQFMKARIIILDPQVLAHKGYLDRIAEMSGMPTYDAKGDFGRDFKTWLKAAIEKIPQHSQVLLNRGAKAFVAQVDETITQRLKDSTLENFARKRLTGSAYSKKRLEEEKKRAAAEKKLGKSKDGEQGSSGATDKKELRKAFIIPQNIKDPRNFILFEMFRFNRIIVDEFTYMLDNKNGAMTSITALQADKRWGLSATPPLKDAYDVAQLARVVGINLFNGFGAPGLLAPKHLAALQKDLTNVELLELSEESPTYALLDRVHHSAQNFLDDFVRQNIQRYDDFPYSDHVVPISLCLDHGISYNELSHRLNSQDMRIKRGNKKAAKGLDNEESVQEAISGVQQAEQALSTKAAFLLAQKKDHQLIVADGQSGLSALLEKRHGQLKEHQAELRSAIQESQRLNWGLKDSDNHFELWQEGVLRTGRLGDEAVTDLIKGIISDVKGLGLARRKAKPASKSSGKKKVDEDISDVEDDGTQEPKDMKQAAGRVNKAALKVLAATRSVRFVANTQRVEAILRIKDDQTLGHCDFEDCTHNIDMSKVSVSSLCGHIVCEPCFLTSQKDVGKCGAPGCSANVQSYNLLPGHKMGPLPFPSSSSTKQGEKVHTVIEMLRRIRHVNQQAILFVRTEEDVDAMAQALAANNISHCTGAEIDEFQTETDLRSKNTVIILNADASSAAGANLTNANHVIFLSPLLKETSYGYDSQMAQAVGRVRRPGQKNPVFVYRMVALHTVDVDILEQREHNDRILTEMKPHEITGARPADPNMDVEMLDEGVASREAFTGAEVTEEKERVQLIRDVDGRFKLVPKSLLLRREECEGEVDAQGAARVKGFEDFNGLIKFSKAYADV